MAKRYHATKKFAKIAALNALQDAGELVTKEKRRLSESWTRRGSKATDGFWNGKHAQPGVVTTCRG